MNNDDLERLKTQLIDLNARLSPQEDEHKQ